MKVALLTNFQEFNPGYSLTGIVLDQIQMLRKFGHEVHLLVNEKYNTKHDHYMYQRVDKDDPKFHFASIVPFTHLIDYNTMMNWSVEHQFTSVQVGNALTKYFKQNEIDVAFTHDWIFTGWNLPYAGGIRFTSVLLPNIAWLHWVHSVPSSNRDWWNLGNYGAQHRIVFPNKTDQRRVAEQFKTTEDKIFVIPHIKDPRVWFRMGKEAQEFIDDHQALLNAEMVQVYPASSDRLSAKGIEQLITIFSAWKKHHISVCLVIANQWATGRQRMEDLEKYKKIALRAGLTEDEFVFTSLYKREYATGIPSRMLQELQQLSTVFFFPTREESFGLVGPEACLCGALPVFNQSLSMMREIYGSNGLYFDFGSFHHTFEPQQGWDKYLEAVAMVTYQKYKTEAAINARSYVRRNFHFEILYRRSYLPAMMDIIRIAKDCIPNEIAVKEVEESMVKFEKDALEFRKKQEEKKKQADNVVQLKKED